MNVSVVIWTVWRKDTREYVGHYTSYDDVPDEYVNGEMFLVQSSIHDITLRYEQ